MESEYEEEYKEEYDVAKTAGFKVAQDLGNFVNPFGHNPDEFITGFQRQHPTLQQSSFRVILKLIEFMASEKYRTDGRNEQSKAIAKKLMAGFIGEYHKELLAQGVSPEKVLEYTGEFYLPSKFLGYV